MTKFIGNRFGDTVPIGPGAAAGPAVYNTFDQYYAQQESGWIANGMSATGGIINEYSEPNGSIYRSHTFLVGGTFNVTDLGDLGGTVDILVVGGGAGGNAAIVSYWTGAGGGAGGMAVATNYPVATSPGSYTITVGAGGQASAVDPGSPNANYQAQSGSPSVFTNPSSPQTITALGGGAGGTGGPGGGRAPTGQAGLNGGSGGGGGPGPGSSSGGTGQQPSQNPGIPNLTNYGNDGAAGDSSSTVGRAGGGGGAGGNAEAIDSNPAMTTNNEGGAGVANSFRFGSLNPITYAAGGGVLSPSPGAPNPTANFFVPDSGLGNGGGGGTDGTSGEPGGNGGPGCVVIRYKIGEIVASAKASGGSVSFYNGKTIHAFTSSGTMTFPSAFNETVEYVVIGGGGGGGLVYGGGGGAGAYRTGTTPVNATPGSLGLTVTIGAGAAGESTTTYIPAAPVGKIGRSGSASSINFPTGTITSAGGGYGGAWDDLAGGNGGSGGGGGSDNPTTNGSSGGTGSGDPFPGTIGATPSNGWGHNGGQGGQYLSYGSGGGGGAGGAGESTNSGNSSTGRKGGAGIQLPSTFRDPKNSIGASGPTSAPHPSFDTSGKYWVAGGGAGGIGGATGLVRGGGGGAPTPVGSYAGGGFAGFAPTHPQPTPYPDTLSGQSGGQGTGGGGGGSGGVGQGSNVGTYGNSGSGGSGLVLVAYPT